MRLKVVFILLIITAFSNLPSLAYSTKEQDIIGSSIIIKNIIYEGNRKTKISVINRELLFKPNDTLTPQQFQKHTSESIINLKNLALFNFVTIDTLHNYYENNVVDLKVSVIEQWYFWPNPKLTFADRNINAWLETCDWKRLNYGFVFRHENLWGLMHTAELTLIYGYNPIIGVTYKVPFFDKRKLLGLNVIAEFTTSKQLPYVTSSSHHIQYYENFGKNSQNTQKYGLEFIIRPKFKTTHTIGLTYNNNNVLDTILKLNPHYSPNQQKTTEYFTISYKVKYDKRDYKSYPLKGAYIDASLSQSGLGILEPEKSVCVTTLITNLRKYFNLANRWHYAVGFIGNFTFQNNQPYIFNSGLGSARIELRGYENYAIDGTNYCILKNNAKYTIMKDRVFHAKGIHEKWGKVNLAIYGNIFFDMGYVAQNYLQPIGIYNNKFLFSGGLGIDFVTYYDKVLRIDATINREGKFGVYLHFTAPI